MTTRWEDAVRHLYEWYRAAPDEAVYTGWSKPGWIDAREGEAQALLAAALHLDAATDVDALIQEVGQRDLAGALGFASPQIRLAITRRRLRSRHLLFKFVATPPLKKADARGKLPASIIQTSLFGGVSAPTTEHAAVGPVLDGVGPSSTIEDATVDSHCANHDSDNCDGPTLGIQPEQNPDDGPTGLDEATDPDRATLSHIPNERIVYDDQAVHDEPLDLNNLPDGWQLDEFAPLDEPESPAVESAPANADDAEYDAETDAFIKATIRRLSEANNAVGTPPSDVVTAPWGEASMTVAFLMRERALQLLDEKGRLVVCKPSPGVGKTKAMIEMAIAFHRARKRVIFAIYAKAQLEELRDRFRQADGTVALRVITGRDESNCDNYDQVKAATGAGYAPGGAVCLGCPSYPENARNLGTSVCLYYSERIRACQDFNLARRGVRRYPLILTTHSSAVLGQEVARSKHGTFWHSDFVFFDEDCSTSFQTEHVLREQHLQFQKADHPYAGFNAAILEAMALAEFERQRAAKSYYKNPTNPAEPDPIHQKHGSAYVGDDLFGLLERVIHSPRVQRFYRHDPIRRAQGLATRVLSHDADDRPGPGDMVSLTPQQISAYYPHRSILTFAELLDREHWAIEAEATDAAQRGEAPRKLSYSVRLEYVLDKDSGRHVWQLACLTPKTYRIREHNIIIGDAYADPAMYQRMFPEQRLETVDVRAHWPKNTFCFSILSHSTVGDVGASEDQYRRFLEAHIAPILEGQRGRRVLFYTMSKLEEMLRLWLEDMRERWGMTEYAIEHYGGGRGKDQYRDWDTVITANEYIPNMLGLVHVANALNPNQLRVCHWGGDRPRKGKQSFGQSLDDMHHHLKGLFQRKCIDETAQAIHRIRPAIPRPDGSPPKQIFIFRKHIPLADDLLSATTFLVAEGDSEDGLMLDDAKGKRATAGSLLAFVNPEEMAKAIQATRTRLGYWGHFAAHALTGLVWEETTFSKQLTRGFERDVAQDGHEPGEDMPLSPEPPSVGDSLRRDIWAKPPRGWSAPEAFVSTLCDRVAFPTDDWDERAKSVQWSYSYRAAMRILSEGEALGQRSVLRAPWQAGPGRGFDCWGDPRLATKTLEAYDPKLLDAQEEPF